MTEIINESIFKNGDDKFAVEDASFGVGMGLAKIKYKIVLWESGGWSEVTSFEPSDIVVDDPTEGEVIQYAEDWIENNWA